MTPSLPAWVPVYCGTSAPTSTVCRSLPNLNLRKAITFALDRDAITGDVLKGWLCPAYTAVPPRFATAPTAAFSAPNQTKFAEFCAYDPDKAKELFTGPPRRAGQGLL